MTSPLDGETRMAAETLWDYHCIYHPLEQADAIIGLGSYDLRVADRCAELLADGLAPRIIFTGASGNWTHGRFAGSEAEAFTERAIAYGVPRKAITLEERATNIGENIRNSAALAKDASRVIVVTKPQTQRRCLATVARQWPQVHAIVTAPMHGFTEQPTDDYSEAQLISEMVGDLHRLQTYPALGYQVRQEIPKAVATAFEHLVAAGFTAHLPSDTR